MRKSVFKGIVENFRWLNMENFRRLNMENYRKVPLRAKIRFLVDFLDEDHDNPEFRLLCVLLLRSLLMEDFEAAWNTLTNLERKLNFLDKIKMLLLDNSASLAIRQYATHIASIVLKSGKMGTTMEQSFLDFMLTHVQSTGKQKENMYLLFFLVAPVVKKDQIRWSAFLNNCFTTTNEATNVSSLSFKLASGCTIFASLLEGSSDAGNIPEISSEHEWIPRRLFKSFSNVDCGFEDGSIFQFVDSSRMTLQMQCCLKYGLAMTGIKRLDLVEMMVNADMQKRGIPIDRKPMNLFISYFPPQTWDLY